MPETNLSVSGSGSARLTRFALVPACLLITLLFTALLFPWEAVGRRVAWEINRVSAADVEMRDISPALTARGPVLRARDLVVDHPAVERVRLAVLELAPRFSTSWFSGEPTIRVWAETSLGVADGLLRLGAAPAYRGRVSEVEIARLPLRLDSNELQISGRLDADVDVALDPAGTLQGRIEFDSPSLRIQTALLPVQIPFSRTTGVIEILESGATRISDVSLEGDVIEGTLAGEVGLVHRSQPPPLDFHADLRILDATLARLAPAAGLRPGPDGEVSIELTGNASAPRLRPARGERRDRAARAAGEAR